MEGEIFGKGGPAGLTLGAGMRKSLMELRSAKSRRDRGEFLVEGTKAVAELMPLFTCRLIVATYSWIERNGHIAGDHKVLQAKRADMERLSSMSNPPEVIALFEMPRWTLDYDTLHDKLVVALDDVQDPGNLGTIIRLCDWFGVDTIICSPHTVDVFNPKVIQATMGAIGRVRVCYADLEDAIPQISDRVYGTFLDGESIYQSELPQSGVIVMGNEGHGISSEVAEIVTHRLLIPSYPADVAHVESLNVSMATAITLSEFRRR